MKGFSTPEAIEQEARMEATAILMDAIERDVLELSDLRLALDNLIAGMASAGPAVRGREHFEQTAALLASLIREDLTENRRHRSAVRVLTEVSA